MRTLLLSLLFLSPTLAAEPDAETLMSNAHWKRAREVVEAKYRTNPNDAHTNYLLARVRQAFGKLDEAVKCAETAVRLDPKSSNYHRVLGEIYANQAENVSVFKQLGLARKIRAEFDAALAIAPHDPEGLFDRMQYYQEAPGVAGGDKKKAAQMAAEIMQIDPARGYRALAYLARREKQNDKLEGYYQKAAEVSPRNYGARLTFANFNLSSPNPNFVLSEQHARAALDLNPDRMDAYRTLVTALVLQKRGDEAAKVIARAEAVIPDDLSPYVFAARALLRDHQDLSKAETYLKKYISETKEPEPYAPPLAGAHWSLALVHEQQDRKPDAKSELETALRLKPDFEPARRDLKRFK